MSFFGSSKQVGNTAEFHRIANLPRRIWSEKDLESLAEEMTARLKTPDGTQRLRPMQALALHDFGVYNGLVGMIRVGGGKCHGRGTPILMFDGTVKAVESVVVGDLLMGPDSTPRTVTSTCTGRETLYRVVPVKGDSYVVNESHILCLKQTRTGFNFPCNEPSTFDMPVTEYLGRSEHFKANVKGFRTGVDFQETSAEEPYMLGMWLGDGTTSRPDFTTADPETVSDIAALAERFCLNVRVSHRPNNASKTYHLNAGRHGGYSRNGFLEFLRSEGVLGNKHIPHKYKANTREVRLAVLAGLMDSDGHLHHDTGYDYISGIERLADDVCFIARSLGLAAYKKECRKECVNSGIWGTYYRVSISGDCSVIPCRLPRKKAAVRRQKKDHLITGIRLEKLPVGDYFGFEISGTDRRYLLGDFTVTHNTLISLLLPNMTTPIGQVPVLFLPAGLREKTAHDRQIYSKHWKIANQLRVESYDMLSRVDGASFLDRYKPDMLILDEAHRAKNKRAGVTRRLIRYMQQNPGTRVAVMSGTLVKKTLKDAAHLIRWALKGDSPIPLNEGELMEWADALDEGVNELRRLGPGPLISFAKPSDRTNDPLATARKGFRDRLIQTPGVVATTGEQVDCSLNIRAVRFPEDAVTNQHFETLRSKWETPDGWTFAEGVTAWRHARELSLGFNSVWDPRPPTEWLDARKAWAAFVRETLSRSRHLDTELQVRLACDAGEIRSPELETWKRVQPTFTPHPKEIWHDSSALDFCEAWMKREKGIVWCEHVFFAKELSRRSGVPYFGEQALTERGDSLVALAASNKAGKVPIICSVKACGTGQNLQAWDTNLITTGITQAADLEQLLGRTHRDGQMSDEVNVDIMLGCWETLDAWTRCNAQSASTKDTYGDEHKILAATVYDFPDAAETLRLTGARWKKNQIVKTKTFDPWAEVA